MPILSDASLSAITAADAVRIMMEALEGHYSGALEAPVRFSVGLGEGQMVFTAGCYAGRASGFRLYSAGGGTHMELTLVLDDESNLVGVVTGSEVGRRRTGALGGAAAAACARTDATTIGFVGAGSQAFTQLWAISTVRPLKRIRVYSRTSTQREAFAARCEEELGLSVEIVDDAYHAVHDTDIVVMSTPSPTPLIDAAWISEGTAVHTLGPKGHAEGECPHAFVDRADLLFSDSPAQLLAMEGDDQPWTRGRRAVPLGAIVAGAESGRTRPQDITCYASVGLAGTEVLLARRALELAGEAGLQN
jgi:alanine dehydrogenase